MKRFVIGDLHGAHRALLQCLERSKFNRAEDLLISLGDVCDGWPEVDKVIDEFLQLKHFKMILGNHDQWALRWMKDDWRGKEWLVQGGSATLESYHFERAKVPESHLNLLLSAPYYLEIDQKLFVHGGFDPDEAIEKQDSDALIWDRNLQREAVKLGRVGDDFCFGKWKDVFIGHTPTQHYQKDTPFRACNVWSMDTGAGWSGRLSLMDIDSYEYWQSDPVPQLYPHIQGRH